MFALAILSIVQIGWPPALDSAAINRLKKAFRYPAMLILSLSFFIVLLSFWHTADYGYWLERLRIKLPFLVLPLVFIALPRFHIKQLNFLFYFLMWTLFFTCLGIGINYLLHFDEINLLMTKGHPMPTPRNHIRLSLLMAIGIVGGGHLYLQKYYLRHRLERPLILAVTIFLFFFMHLMTVRTGLLALYFSLLLLLISYVLRSRRYFVSLLALLGLLSIPVMAYLYIPSINKRVGYMLHDLNMYSQGKGAVYSDSGRLTSLKIGAQIFREHPVWGVGAGNLRDAMQKKYTADYPDYESPHMPHNQFLFVAAGTGVIGLVVFCLSVFYPLFYKRNYQFALLTGLFAIYFTGMMLEHIIENAAGVATFSFFILLLLSYLNKPEEDSWD